MFLLISGLGLYYSWKNNPNYKNFISKRYSRILIPYCLVAIIAWAWRDFVIDKVGISVFLEDISFVSLFTRGVKWFWYIFMMGICYLIFPIIYNSFEKSKSYRNDGIKILLLFCLSTIFAGVLRDKYHTTYANTSILIFRFPMFVLGCWIGKLSYNKVEIDYGKIGAIGIFLFITLFVLKSVNYDLIRSYLCAFYNICICVLVVLIFERIDKTKGFQYISNILGWCGSYSLELYLVHVTIRRVMNILGYRTYRYSYEIIMIFLSIIVSIILKKVSNSIQSKVVKNVKERC